MQGLKGGAQVSLLNIITELKKCCNHPVSLHAGSTTTVSSACPVNPSMRTVVAVCCQARSVGLSGCASVACSGMQFLFDSAEADFRGSEGDVNAVDRLTVTSGKMVLLDKLLRRLRETGHRYAALLPQATGCRLSSLHQHIKPCAHN